jgi:hypothetical protein
MKLTRLQKILSVAAAILFALTFKFDGTPASIVFCFAGLALVAYVIHTLPKRSTKCTDL